MKNIVNFLIESIKASKNINEGPGSGVDMNINGTLKFLINIKNSKITLDNWKIYDITANVSSYDYNYDVEDAGRLIEFDLFGKSSKYYKPKDILELPNKLDIKKYFKNILSTPVASLIYSNSDLLDMLKENNLTESSTIEDLSTIFDIELYYDDGFEITDLSLNPGGYTTRNITSNTNLFGSRSDIGFSSDVYLIIDNNDYGQIQSDTILNKTLTDLILPDVITPSKELIDIYDQIHNSGYNGNDDPDSEDFYPAELWWDDIKDTFKIK